MIAITTRSSIRVKPDRRHGRAAPGLDGAWFSTISAGFTCRSPRRSARPMDLGSPTLESGRTRRRNQQSPLVSMPRLSAACGFRKRSRGSTPGRSSTTILRFLGDQGPTVRRTGASRVARSTSVLIAADDSPPATVPSPPGAAVDRRLDEANAAIGEQGIDPAGVIAPRRDRAVQRLVLADQQGQDVEVRFARGVERLLIGWGKEQYVILTSRKMTRVQRWQRLNKIGAKIRILRAAIASVRARVDTELHQICQPSDLLGSTSPGYWAKCGIDRG